ncbi:hypothetical protein LNP00_03530 [Fructobacillus sp. M158]|uniref:CHY zinc finger protein n=1 Tax=Fructobacillus parabroussonetiae TaxID=2713174 RepID=UPI00200A65BA|nr:CHY zinc finger protein [Fructobacillus parabroussonetiae]MCK8617438.1 hypothetical protein [Fructobacillus parabroussonetiae]
MATVIHGLGLGPEGTCQHYHSDLDVVALLCGTCQVYFACYHCHDALQSHAFTAVDEGVGKPVLCGRCRTKLSYQAYQKGFCPNCQAAFNPACARHHDFYFKS